VPSASKNVVRAEFDMERFHALDVIELLNGAAVHQQLRGHASCHGRFRRGDNRQEDRALIERAPALFEQMGATAWAGEAPAVRAES
jgi:hypothetical protein